MKIKIKTPQEIGVMREGGTKLVQVFKTLISHAQPGTALIELDKIARAESERLGAEPSFLGYQGYPAAICTSVNKGIVHCIPDGYILKEGDLLSIDFGLLYKGLHTDSAISIIIGEDIHEYIPFLKKTYQALAAGVQAVKAGNKVGDISQAIEESLNKSKLTIMRQFVGHGIGYQLHEAPTVPNFVGHDKNVILPANSVIAIEPIASLGQEAYFTKHDGWSTETVDKSVVAHFEETVVVTEHGPEILTPIEEILDFIP